MALLDLSLAQAAIILFSIAVAYGIVLAIYRVTLHPLAKFPGPKLAAATRWYETYHDLKGSGGLFSKHIDELHKIYGPIVRINPEELHIHDSSYFSTVYANNKDKHGWAANLVGAPKSSFGSKPYELHHARRAVNMPFLTKKSVVAREHILTDNIRKVLRILQQNDGQVIDIYSLALAYASETVWQFTLSESLGLLEPTAEQGRAQWRETNDATLAAIPLLRSFGWIMPLTNMLPLAFLKVLAPPVAQITSLHADLTQRTQRYLDSRAKADVKGKDQPPETILDALYYNSLPMSEKTALRFGQEGFTVTAAAGNTTAHHLAPGVYYLLSNPNQLEKFREAMKSLPSGIPSWTALQQQPYIKATIKEILRLRGMTTGRGPLSSRIPLQYKDWTIPSNTPVSLTIRNVLLDPEVFENPLSFQPERWLADDAEKLEPYYIPFSKGSRNCQGLELAYAELYLFIATIFREFDFELVDMDFKRDLEYASDCLIAVPSKDSKSVRVKVKALNV